VVLGSLIAFQVGNERVNDARRKMEKAVRREPPVPLELMRQ
jgi:hypothetical protein